MSIATACANIALVKYWGKRDAVLNLPERGSLSLTLDALRTYTSVEKFSGNSDELIIDDQPQSGKALKRVTEFLDLVRAEAKTTERARVISKTTFPLAAGLASSASGFAALAVAAAAEYGLKLSAAELSALARRGSGSAARSIFGGLVRMDAGKKADGSDAVARPLFSREEYLQGVTFDQLAPFGAVIAVADAGAKEVGSTDGMEATKQTSPYHSAWLDQVDRDLAEAERLIRDGTFSELAEIVEGSCLAMHADAMAARPGIIYFKPVTLWAIDRVRELRKNFLHTMFTVDAGPHVVAFTVPEHMQKVAKALSEHPQIKQVITSRAGEGAHLIERMP